MALGASLAANDSAWNVSGTALAMWLKVTGDIIDRVLAHPSKNITQKTAQVMEVEMTGQWGTREACFQAKTKQYAVTKTIERTAIFRRRERANNALKPQHDGCTCSMIHEVCEWVSNDEPFGREDDEVQVFITEELGEPNWSEPGRVGQTERVKRSSTLSLPHSYGTVTATTL